MIRLSFERMWNLIEGTFVYSHYLGSNYRRFIGPELMIAVFWEETLFVNLPGVGGAVGFGQVQRPTIERLNHFWEKEDGKAMTFVAREVLADDVQSVQLAGLTMAMEYETQIKFFKKAPGEDSLKAAMINYAGGKSGEQAADLNRVKALAWFPCRDALRALNIKGAALAWPSADLADSIMNSLNKTTRKLGDPNSPLYRGDWEQNRRILFPTLR